MSIVFITIPGDIKRHFANTLYEETGGALKVVIVQRPKKLSFFMRLKRLFRRVGLLNLPKEFFYGVLLRINRARHALEYFRTYSDRHVGDHLSEVIEVDSVNDDEVFNILKKISPDLLVIWGSTVLEPRIYTVAKKAINLHMGYCPHYRGALANHTAVLMDDFSNIGATIHYVAEKVDAGEILLSLRGNTDLGPKRMFIDLNDRALSSFVDVSKRLWMGEHVDTRPQDISGSKNLLLKHWTPSVRYKVGRKIIDWEKGLLLG
ncbi:MAG: Formyl transferase domain protein [Parcubacteria bacterium C7867-005]|nr:MAG: Formyl transferase domain protein [Parcubacteria bacterium C7867-005]